MEKKVPKVALESVMQLARVIGTVVATVKNESLEGRKLLVVQTLNKDLEPAGKPMVAVDSVGAGVGERGVGYFVEELQANITTILGLDNPHRVAIIGAGRLGTALANYHGFEKSNFRVVALFDNDASKIGQHLGSGDVLVHDVKKIARIVKEEDVDVAVIAVPARAAQRVLNQVMAAGVKAVLNFAPASLSARLGVKVKTVDLTTSLESLSYFLARPQVSVVTNPRRSNNFEETFESQEQKL